MKLLALIRNENMKLYHMPSTWVMLCISFASVLAVLLLTTLQGQPEGNYWTSVFDLFLTENQIMYVVLILFVSQIVNNEFSSGTAKLLFIRPASRLQIMVAKWISTMQFAFLVLLFNLISCLLLALPISGIAPLTEDLLLQLYTISIIKLASFIFYTTLFFSLAMLVRNTVLFIIMGLVLMGSLQVLPSLIIFPETSLLFSAVCWLIFCGSILIFALVSFKKSDI